MPTPTEPVPTAPVPTAPVQAPIPIPPSCFSALNFVEVKGVGEVAMSQLKIGDYVKTNNNDFTQVYGFGHYDHDLETDFIQIILEGTLSVEYPPTEVTSHHLVFVERNNKQYTIPAGDVIIGDTLNGKRVQMIQSISRRGVYAPLTQSGEIMVNGIRASNYINVLDFSILWDQHVYAHAFFFPQRLFCRYFLDTCTNETYVNGYGLLTYITIGIGTIVNHCGCFAILIFSLVCIPVVAVVYTMESMNYLLVLSITVVLCMIMKRTRTKEMS
jgi:Hint module